MMMLWGVSLHFLIFFWWIHIYVLYNNDMMEMLQKFDISVVKSSKRQSQCCGRLYTTDAEIKQGGGTLC